MEEISYKSNKKDIWDAYVEALDSIKELERSLERKELEIARLKSASGVATVPTTVESKKEKQATVATPEVVGIQSVLEFFKKIEAGLTPAINELSALQVAEADKIEQLQSLIAKEETEIKELYNVVFDENALSKLIEEYLRTQSDFSETIENKKLTFERELLEMENAWRLEQENHKDKIAARNAETKKEMEREAEQYKYRKEQEKAEAEDNYAQERKNAARELIELQSKKEAEWAAREETIVAQEKVLQHYKVEFEGLATRLDKEVKKAETEARSLVEREQKIKMKLLQTETEGEQAAMTLHIKDLNADIEKQQTQIEKLYKQLEDAQRQVQTLAMKALEGSANNDSYKAVREIAIEQAKNMGK